MKARILALLLALVMVASLFAACQRRKDGRFGHQYRSLADHR